MSGKHISFEILSDLYDNELSEISKSQVLIHLEECESCKREYETLVRVLKLVSLSVEVKVSYELSPNIIDIFKERKEQKDQKDQKEKAQKKRRAYYFVPAAAAVVLIFGVGLFFYGNYNVSNHKNIAQTTHQTAPQKPVSKPISRVQFPVVKIQTVESASIENGLNETQRIISIISDSNARILNIFENSIEGEISEDGFAAFIDSLENRKIVSYKVRPSELTEMNRWLGGLEPVAFSDSFEIDDIEIDSPPVIRFKIYKR